MTYVDFDASDHRSIQVRLDDGRWVDGALESYKKVQGGAWSAHVRYTLRRGETRIAWFEEGRTRGAGVLG